MVALSALTLTLLHGRRQCSLAARRPNTLLSGGIAPEPITEDRMARLVCNEPPVIVDMKGDGAHVEGGRHFLQQVDITLCLGRFVSPGRRLCG